MCMTSENCTYAASYLTKENLSLEFNFTGSSVDNESGKSSDDGFIVSLEPTSYLWQNPTTGYCESLITVVDTSESDAMFILGDPFFR